MTIDIAQDPTGLFLVTSGVSPKKIKQTLSLNSSLQIMEIGTGVTFDAGCQIFGISFIKWLEAGRFIVLGTREGKIYVTEAQSDIRETILDAQEQIKTSPFWWDQWKLGKEECDPVNTELIQRDFYLQATDPSSSVDAEIQKLQEARLKKNFVDAPARYEYQDLHNGVQLMVHANPYFKYPKDLQSKMPRLNNKTKVQKAKELESEVLFLNRGILGQNGIAKRSTAQNISAKKGTKAQIQRPLGGLENATASIRNQSPNRNHELISQAKKAAIKKPLMQKYHQMYDSRASIYDSQPSGIDIKRA